MHKPQAFETYVVWRSLPSLLRGKDEVELAQFGISDQLTIELLGIKSQADFRRLYGLSTATLADWNKRIDADDNLSLTPIVSWMRSLTPNVLTAVYQKAVKYGDAQRAKVWLEATKMIGQQTVINGNVISQTKVVVNERVINIGLKYERELKEAIVAQIRGPERLRAGGAPQRRKEVSNSNGDGEEAEGSEGEGA